MQQLNQQKSQQQHLHMQQQIILQRQAQQQQQQQRRDGAQLINGNANGITNGDPLMRANPGSANAMAAKMYEDKLKLPLQREASDDNKVTLKWIGWSLPPFFFLGLCDVL